jgi:hypothetical protein
MRAVLLGTLLTFCGLSLLSAQEGKGEEKSLFNGKDLTGWKFRGGEGAAKRSKWTVTGGLTLDPKTPTHFASPTEGSGILLNGGDGRGVDLLTDLQHGDCELHIEFNVAKNSNSGIYFQGQYEVQILDSHGKKDADLRYGDCGGIYDTAPPRTNASKPPGEWQSFDVVFRAPHFDAAGKKTANARFVRVLHNGTLIHENVEVKRPTTGALGAPERAQGPLLLQGDHGPVAFRNIRIKLLPAR